MATNVTDIFDRLLLVEIGKVKTFLLDEQPPLVAGICGGRDFVRFGLLCHTMDFIHRHIRIGMLTHGGAPGADKMGGLWAQRRGVGERSISARWTELGKAAGPIRNQAVLDSIPRPLFIVAMPGGTGTGDMIVRSRQQGFPVIDVEEILEDARG